MAALTSPNPLDLVHFLGSEPDALFRLARERLGPLAAWRLQEAGLAQGLLPEVRRFLKEEREREVRWELAQTAALLDLLEATSKLRPLGLKGLDFRTRLYPPGTRPAQDIDIYLERHRFPEFARLAEKTGWRLVTRGRLARRLWRSWNHLIWKKGPVILEVHYALTAPGRYNASYPFGREPMPLELDGVRLWVPQPEDAALFALVHLCGNHFFDCHLLSVHDLLLLCPGLDWGKLSRWSEQAGLFRTVSFACAYLRGFPPLAGLLPPGEPLSPGRWEKWFLYSKLGSVRTRSRLLNLYLAEPPSRSLIYALGHLKENILYSRDERVFERAGAG